MDFIFVFFLLFLFVSILSVSAILVSENNIYAQTERKISNSFDDIQIYDSSFTSSLIVKDLDFLTTMDFLGPDDFLVLEKNTGLVKRITNGTLNETPLIHLNVSSSDERGAQSQRARGCRRLFDQSKSRPHVRRRHADPEPLRHRSRDYRAGLRARRNQSRRDTDFARLSRCIGADARERSVVRRNFQPFRPASDLAEHHPSLGQAQ